ncbi:MAG: hypothetical protein AMXMBFR84_37590 [Candidatus Hydrogenedentota bacterium]
MAGANDYGTPLDIFQACERRWGKFSLDVCAHRLNAKCKAWYGEPGHPLAEGCTALDGLAQPWYSRNWLNPPYSAKGPNGKMIGVAEGWIRKAIQEAKNWHTTVALVKNDPSTEWFKLGSDCAAEVWFPRGSRIRFFETIQLDDGSWDQQPSKTPPFTTCIMVFRRLHPGERQHVGWWDV